MTLHKVRQSFANAYCGMLTSVKDLGPNLTAVVLVTGLFAFISMGLRTYVRVTKRSWGLEDWIMAVGCVSLRFTQ